MGGSSTTLHEDPADLSTMTRDVHRALVSLQEELEAVDWYRQRADACRDAELREILLHNMREEIEHAAMVLEWLRRRDPDFQEHLSTYLFAEGSILEAEEAATSGTADGEAPPAETPAAETSAGLTLGSLKGDH
ncbi:encapsulin-associated ferritin-like protein [Thiococcus pfennigii]|jgi:ferritin-like protein|uniref:encapsulin-associated ferritin-like protein n=1 Tax=Thiococcus pfennigii TaxID=1057 RepID=UPI00190578F5|nr:encapsulin-associated ferritin-like protein [Thiococcus pfennigii]MBK1701288.1 ferritin [Thiococcus pfennigii]MBK1730317.1 ferritin [Thiococcus pfennigii]